MRPRNSRNCLIGMKQIVLFKGVIVRNFSSKPEVSFYVLHVFDYIISVVYIQICLLNLFSFLLRMNATILK